jgi:transposase
MSTTERRVVIGMDPHKRSVTIEVMAADETILGAGPFCRLHGRAATDSRRRARCPVTLWSCPGRKH